MTEAFVDYGAAFPEAQAAQGKGRNFLALYCLAEPHTPVHGRPCDYRLDYRWLSQACSDPDDEAWACAQGAESTYWQILELPLAVRLGHADLFEHFDLF